MSNQPTWQTLAWVGNVTPLVEKSTHEAYVVVVQLLTLKVTFMHEMVSLVIFLIKKSSK